MAGKNCDIPFVDDGGAPTPSAPPLPDDHPQHDHDHSHSAEDVTRAPVPEDNDCVECPVCMEPINTNDSAMRCNGDGGVAHLFHARCLTPWIQSCRERNTIANCPVCRGPVQVHKRRLEQFLQSEDANKLDQDSRGMLGSLLETLNARIETLSDGWTVELTNENILAGAGVMASVAYGFYTGYTGRHSYLTDNIFWHNATPSMMAANAIGYVVGMGIRIWKTPARDTESESDRRQHNQSRRR